MNSVKTDLPRLQPTSGQLALAEAIARGENRTGTEVRHVPANVYTDPEHFAREKAALFDRLPQVLCASAGIGDQGRGTQHLR